MDSDSHQKDLDSWQNPRQQNACNHTDSSHLKFITTNLIFLAIIKHLPSTFTLHSHRDFSCLTSFKTSPTPLSHSHDLASSSLKNTEVTRRELLWTSTTAPIYHPNLTPIWHGFPTWEHSLHAV